MRKPLPPAIEATLTRVELAAPFTSEPEHDDEPLSGPTRAQVLVGPDFVTEWDPFKGECHRIVRVHQEGSGA